MTDFSLEADANGVATITWDVPGKSMNVLTFEQVAKLDALVDEVLSNNRIKGAVITSGKNSFSAGMDLNALASLKPDGEDFSAQHVFDTTMNLHRVLRKIERGQPGAPVGAPAKPFVAALTGTTLGIGYEIALACHHVIVADDRTAKIGLPEIRVGLFPGAGGTTRLVRKLGLLAASTYLFEGRLCDPAFAKKAGLVDDVVDATDLLAAAKLWAAKASNGDFIKPWDSKGYRIPGGSPYQVDGFPLFMGASAQILGKTQNVYPAARAMLSAIYEGSVVPFDTALRIEARWFTSVISHPSSSAMINTLFVSRKVLEKGSSRPANVTEMKVRRLGVLGAGMMGAGIGYVAAVAGIQVILLDQNEEAAQKGCKSIASLLKTAVRRSRLTTSDADAALARVAATVSYERLSDCNLIIEAVFEDPEIKARVINSVSSVVGDKAIIATNTSTLPVSELANSCELPERFVGTHFFSPVHKMRLVEIIRGKETGDAAVACALDFAKQIGKTPIVVNDARFFYTNRCIIPYINEGIRMVGEGIKPAMIENAAKQLGMPLGPLQLVDETSIELGVMIAKATQAAMGGDFKDHEAMDVMTRLVDMGRTGRKRRAGFYSYDERGRRTGLWQGLSGLWPPARNQPEIATVKRRLFMIQVFEAVHALEEGVIENFREGDVGAVLGWGFAPWSGGPFSWLDRVGISKAVEVGDSLAHGVGDRFNTPALLRDMAKDQTATFYGRCV